MRADPVVPLMLSHADRAAIQAFPELRRLIELRNRPGWLFRPTIVGCEMTAIEGLRAWPYGHQDSIDIESLSVAAARRVDHRGAVTGTREGTLDDVLRTILDEWPSPARRGPRPGRHCGKPAAGLWRPL